MLAQHPRVVVNHLVRRMSAPITDDLTAHPGIDKVRNPASPKSVHPGAGLGELQLPQDGLKLLLRKRQTTTVWMECQ